MRLVTFLDLPIKDIVSLELKRTSTLIWYEYNSFPKGFKGLTRILPESVSQVVVAMRDLFQVVYDLKKKDVEKNKQYSFDGSGNKMVN